MVDWLEPLKLQTIFVNIFAGDPEYFLAIALIVIFSFAGYFRMTGSVLFFMVGLFILMFSGFIMGYWLALFSIFAGLIVGYTLSRIFER